MELVNFREELKNNAIEGLYDCVCDYIPEWLKDKVKRCHLNIPTRLYVEEIYDRNIWEKIILELEKIFKLIQRNCPISSSYPVFRI